MARTDLGEMGEKRDSLAWLITGSRFGHPYVKRVLDEMLSTCGVPVSFVCGDAPGVDTAARMWAIDRLESELVQRFRVNDALGSPRKFHDRNERMVAACQPNDRLFAFPNGESRGTWNTVLLGARAGLQCIVIWPNGNSIGGPCDAMERMALKQLGRKQATP